MTDALPVDTRKRVPCEAVRRFLGVVFQGHGVPPHGARIAAASPLEAERHGVASRGIPRLPGCARPLREGLIDPDPHLRAAAARGAGLLVAADRSLLAKGAGRAGIAPL